MNMFTIRFLPGVLCAIATISLALPEQARAQSLRYEWQQGQKFSYDFDITVEGDATTTTYKGLTHYTVDAVSPEQLRVTYRGGLRESTKSKQTSRGPGGFSPFGGFGRPPNIPSPFERPTFAGKSQTTNKITLTPRGNILAMEGDSQLPYLLGNVSLLPFESLPDGTQREWSTDTGVSITEENENRRGRFGPFDPFGSNDKGSVQAAGEVTRYNVQATNGDLVTVKRTYQLAMPKTADNASFSMTGSGTWTFDRKDKVPQALEMSYNLTSTQGNSTTRFPISVKYRRIAAAELAKMEESAKREADEKAHAAAVAKNAAEAPLTSDEKRDALSVLSSGNAATTKAKLGELAAKTPTSPDPEIASAIERLLGSPNSDVAKAAAGALVHWSPDFKLRKALAKDYQGPGVLKSTGRVVESITPLYVGQLVQAQQPRYGDFWRAAQVQELLPDGRVKLGFLTWGEAKHSDIVARRSIQLAPDELEQPARPRTAAAVNATTVTSAAATATGAARTWSDATGRFKVEAVFVSVGDGTVSIRRTTDNRVIAIPVAKLSAADQAFIEQLQSAENPFAVP